MSMRWESDVASRAMRYRGGVTFPRRIGLFFVALLATCPLSPGPAYAKGGGAAKGAPAAPKSDERSFINDGYPIEFRKRVNASIDRGVRWLLTRQLRDGSWGSVYNKNYPMGPTALTVLTLLKGGVKPEHPAIVKAFAYLRKMPMQKTYAVAVLLMALDARHAPARDPFVAEKVDRYGRTAKKDPCLETIGKEDLAWMKRGVTFLLDHRTAKGVWRYPSKESFDLSCTQYALLGLKAAMRCGIKIPSKVWLDALTFLLAHQEKNGKDVRYQANQVRGRYRVAWTEKAKARGFRYVDTKQPVNGSMTTAGLAGLIICQSELWSARRFKGDLRHKTRVGIRDAMAWLQTYVDVLRNPIQPEKGRPGPGPDARRGGANHHYYLYGLERASILGRIRHYGKLDWYEEGAELLMYDQAEDGHWPNMQPLVDSCFAILFLKRATTGMKVPVITSSGGAAKDTRAKPGSKSR